MHNLHDRVIYQAKIQGEPSFKVEINPNQEKNQEIGELYPDVIYFGPVTGKVEFIAEVETKESLNEESIKQWGEYSKLGFPLWVIVPIEYVETTRGMLSSAGIYAQVAGFSEAAGYLRINFEYK